MKRSLRAALYGLYVLFAALLLTWILGWADGSGLERAFEAGVGRALFALAFGSLLAWPFVSAGIVGLGILVYVIGRARTEAGA